MVRDFLSTRPRIFHPLLASLYPILALLAYNIDQNPFSVALRALAYSIVSTMFLWAVFSWIMKSYSKGAVFATLTIALFFSYGHIYDFIQNSLHHKVLIAAYLLILVFSFVLLVRSAREPRVLNNTLNVVCAVLLLFPLVQIGFFYINLAGERPHIREIRSQGQIAEINLDAPDIYYFILDMYTRGDFLAERMGYDNSAFLDQLAQNGFYIAECSLSNYSTTKFSLTASLNMNYLNELLPEIDPTSTNESLVDPLIQHSEVRTFLENQGYTIVAFQTDFHGVEWRDADHYFDVETALQDATSLSQIQAEQSGEIMPIEKGLLGRLIFDLNLNKFEWLLMQTTAARIILDFFVPVPAESELSSDYLTDIRQFLLVQLTLDQAEQALEIEGPKFVYMHVVSPHPPFVFKPDGAFTTLDPDREYSTVDWYKLYTDQLQYINTRVFALVEKIFASSERPPIIIIQGDHGIPMHGKRPYYQFNEILNAYYLPGGGDSLLGQDISPVNSWRVVLNYYFGTQYELLENRAYTYNWLLSPYNFEPVQEQFAGCE